MVVAVFTEKNTSRKVVLMEEMAVMVATSFLSQPLMRTLSFVLHVKENILLSMAGLGALIIAPVPKGNPLKSMSLLARKSKMHVGEIYWRT